MLWHSPVIMFNSFATLMLNQFYTISLKNTYIHILHICIVKKLLSNFYTAYYKTIILVGGDFKNPSNSKSNCYIINTDKEKRYIY